MNDHLLTHSVTERPFEDFRVSGVSRAQISFVKFLEAKWLLPLNSFLHILFFWTFHIDFIGAEKKLRFDMSVWEFREKLHLNHYSIKTSGGIKMKMLNLTSQFYCCYSECHLTPFKSSKFRIKYQITIYILSDIMMFKNLVNILCLSDFANKLITIIEL